MKQQEKVKEGRLDQTNEQNRLDRVDFFFFKIKIHFISFLKKQTLQKNLNRELKQ